jgi:hypothetical protein
MMESGFTSRYSYTFLRTVDIRSKQVLETRTNVTTILGNETAGRLAGENPAYGIQRLFEAPDIDSLRGKYRLDFRYNVLKVWLDKEFLSVLSARSPWMRALRTTLPKLS